MRTVTVAAIAALTLPLAGRKSPQSTPRILAAIFAHADDEVTIAPILARYARDGVQVHLIIVATAMRQTWNGVLPLAPWFSTSAGTDVFASSR